MIKGYNERERAELNKSNVYAHLQGQYFAEAILATVGNIFKKKTSKSYEYPKKPYKFDDPNKEFTEEELQKQRELFVAKLQVMKTNFELTHRKKER